MGNESQVTRNASALGEWIDYHLEDGRRAAVLTDSQKRAWIRKARQFILLLDPDVEGGVTGLLPRTFDDLTADLAAIDGHPDEFDRAEVVDRHFQSAFVSFEAIRDATLFAPTSLGSLHRSANPYFFDLPPGLTSPTVFVLMPFTSPWADQVWTRLKVIIRDAVPKQRLSCMRADDLYGHDVLLDIVAAIRSAEVVIADISGRNANVFYELGIAHAYGSRVILLTQSAEDIPFDLLRFRHVIYGTDRAGLATLERGIKGALLEILR